jgi:pimeloyl-ACP methyl ester carboxylesterase
MDSQLGQEDSENAPVVAGGPTPDEEFVTTPGGLKVSLREWPGGSPALLMLHGLASSSHIWDFVAPKLSPQYRVIAYDQRGHGQTAKPSTGYDFPHVAKDALDVAQSVRARGPVLVGHSWGANVALEVAARNPRMLRALVLVDGGFLRMQERMDWETASKELAPPPLAGLKRDQFLAMLREFVGSNLEMTPEMEAVFLSYMRIDRGDKIRPQLSRENHMKILRAIWEQDPPALLTRVRVPVLVLAVRSEHPEDEEFAAAKEAAASKIRKIDPRIHFEWIEGIHDVPLQKPDEVAERIRRFVSSLRS